MEFRSGQKHLSVLFIDSNFSQSYILALVGRVE